jgi:hypothetical protein
MVSVPDDIRARFVNSQHHQIDLARRETLLLQKLPNATAHEAQIGRVAGKL